MVTERVEIIITETGARVVKREIVGIGTASRSSADSVAFLQQALITLGGANLLGKLVATADAFTNMQNRVALVTNSVEELNAVTDELLKISNRTRTSIETNAELFNRLSLATRELGVSQGRLLRIVETVNKLVLISGASAKEANNGIIQLSQGLASGALRGDELRSVLEQMPAVADAIALQLGTTRGQLRSLGADFKITSEEVIAAIENVTEATDERFKKVIPTIEQSLTVLGNSLTVAIGRMNQGSGITRGFSEALIAFAEDADRVGRVALAGILTAGIISVTVALNLLTTAILRNPFSALFVAVSAAASTLIVFSDQITALDDNLTTLEDVGTAAFNAISESASNVGFVIAGWIPNIEAANLTFETFVRAVAKGFDRIVAVAQGIGRVIAAFIKHWADGIITTANAIIRFINNTIGGVVGFAKTVGDTFAIIFKGIVVAAKNVGAAIGEAFKGSFDSAEQLLGNAVDSLITTTDVAVSSFGDRLKENFEANNNVLNEAVNPYEDFGEGIGEAFRRGLLKTPISDSVAEIFEDAKQLALEKEKERILAIPEQKPPVDLFAAQSPALFGPAPATSAAFQQVLDDLQQETDLLLLNNDAREIQIQLLKIEEDLRKQGVKISDEGENSQRKQLQTALELIQSLELQADILEEINGPQEEYNKKVEALNQLTGRINTEQFGDALRDLKIDLLDTQTDFASGFERGLEKVNKGFEDFATGAEELVTNAFQNMEDVFVEFATTGKLSFDDLISGIIADLARLASQQLLKDLLGGLTTGGGGDLAGFLAGAFGGAAANGADVMAGKPWLVGEKGPELFVPPTSGTIVPNSQVAQAAAPAAAPQITIVNVTDRDEVAQIMDSPQGEEVVLNILRRNPNAVKQAIG